MSRSATRIEFNATQLGMQMRVALRLDGLAVTTFDIGVSDFERLIDAFSTPPVVIVTYGEPFDDEQLNLFEGSGT